MGPWTRVVLVGAAVLAACTSGVLREHRPATSPSRGSAPTTRLVLPQLRDRDCSDFADRSEAQRALRPGDPDRLDADKDGLACEHLPR
jgi:hypothetical protein